MRPGEIWEVIPCLTGAFAESEAELTSPELQPLILLRWKRGRKPTVIQPSASQDTHSFSQPHRDAALLGVLVLWFPSLVIISSFLLWLAACESSLYEENFHPKQMGTIFNQKIKSFFFFSSFPSLFFYIKAVLDWALQKETQVSFGLMFDHLLYCTWYHFTFTKAGAEHFNPSLLLGFLVLLEVGLILSCTRHLAWSCTNRSASSL